MKRPIPYEEFKQIYSRVPRLSVDMVIRQGSGIVLTLRTIEPCKGQWHLPGGTVLFGESLEGAALRAAREEAGIEARITGMLGIIEYAHEREWGTFSRTVAVVYEAEIVSGELRGSEEGEQIGVFERLPEPMIVDHREFLERHAKRPD